MDVMSLKDVQLVLPLFFFLYYAYPIILNVSNLFILLCCTFHCVNSKMLNEFSILTR